MKNIIRILLCLLLAAANPFARAQERLTVSQALDFWITSTEKEVMSAADAMPAEKYSFAPSAGEFAGVRTFGQQVKHLAANNYRMAAYIVGHTPSRDQENETGPDAVQSKTQIVEYAGGSFIALHRAVAAINEQNMLEPLTAYPSVFSSQRTLLRIPTIITGRWWNTCE